MRIFKYYDKLVEEVGNIENNKVVIMKYLKSEDMDKCECGRPIDKEMTIVERSLIWLENTKEVDTI